MRVLWKEGMSKAVINLSTPNSRLIAKRRYSKTEILDIDAQIMIDYQSKRRYSKTAPVSEKLETKIDYQSKRRYSKT